MKDFKMKKIYDKLNLVEGKESRNRVVMPPMDTLMSKDGKVNDFHKQHYGAKSYGGIGTIIVESTAVSPEGKIRERDLGLWKDDQIKGHKELVKLVHRGGAIIGVQLNHAGSKAEIYNIPTFGPSNFYSYIVRDKYSIITTKQIKDVENKFVASAKRAKEAGYDFIEIHAAHGYLLSTMMHPKTNEVIISHDITIRGEVVINIAKRIHEEVGIRAGIRISFSDHEKNGMVPNDYKPIIDALEPYVDYFHSSSGEVISRARMADVLVELDTILFRLPIAKEVKKYTKKNVIVVGNFSSRKHADKAMEAGIDAVAFGREIIFNPNLAINKLLKASEMNIEDYHWNNNPWFNPYSYAKLKEDLDLE